MMIESIGVIVNMLGWAMPGVLRRGATKGQMTKSALRFEVARKSRLVGLRKIGILQRGIHWRGDQTLLRGAVDCSLTDYLPKN